MRSLSEIKAETPSERYTPPPPFPTEAERADIVARVALLLDSVQDALVLFRSGNIPVWKQALENLHEIGWEARLVSARAERIVNTHEGGTDGI